MGEHSEPSKPFNLTPEDLAVLKKTDDEYVLMSWEYCKQVIDANQLDRLTRTPSQLRAYQAWSAEIQSQYGAVTNFLLQRRLYWKPTPSSDPTLPPQFQSKSPIPFAERSDYRILINDWPYGMVQGIHHVCVWLKTLLPVDDDLGALTEEGTQMVETFVRETFDAPLGIEGQDKVIWFKNPTKIQSIRTVHHVHVLIRDVPYDELVKLVEVPPFK